MVENHDDLRQLLGKFLSEKFDVFGAKTSLEAMAWLSQGIIPDVIVTDKDLPEIDGAELLRQLRCTGLWTSIPVLVFGESKDCIEDTLHFKSLGAQDFFKKPFNPLKLQDKIIQMLVRD